jgi:hypothetical protein
MIGREPRLRVPVQGIAWSIGFVLNLVVSLTLPFILASSQQLDEPVPAAELGGIQLSPLIRLGLVISLVFSVLHLLYALVFPNFYIKFALVCGIISGILSFLGAFMALGSLAIWQVLLLPFSILAFGAYYYYAWRHLAPRSAVLLRETSSVICHNPGLLGLEFVQMVLCIVISFVYAVGIISLINRELPFFLHVYFVFSWFWFIMTVKYINLVIAAGVASSHFYRGNGHFRENFIKGAFSMLGSAAFCGLLLASIQTLRYILSVARSQRKNRRKKDDDDDGKESWVVVILFLLANWLLDILEAIADYLSRNTLLYCGIYGVELREGFNMLNQEGINDRWNRMMHNSMISSAVSVNSVFVTIIAVGVALLFGSVSGYESEQLTILGAVTLISMILLAVNLTSAIGTVSDTLQLCFIAWPQKLQQKAQGLYDELNHW